MMLRAAARRFGGRPRSFPRATLTPRTVLPCRAMRRRRSLTYGVVRVLDGRHRGKLGYYDNETDDGRRAIVYFGPPLGLDFARIWLGWLRQATAAERRRFEVTHMNELAYRRGMLRAFDQRPLVAGAVDEAEVLTPPP